MSAAPGTGTATRARAATSRAWTTPTRSPTSCSRNGCGASATPPSPRSSRYLNHVADRFDLRRDIRFNTRVEPADLRRGRRRVWAGAHRATATRHRPGSSSLATGSLSRAKLPEFPGSRPSRARCYHTGQWPHEGVDFTGKRVAVIGTGSSASRRSRSSPQAAEHLTVFQRTPNYAHPARQPPADPDESRAVKANYADLRDASREPCSSACLYASRQPLGPRRSRRGAAPDLRRAVGRMAGSSCSSAAFTDVLFDKPGQRNRRRVRPRARSASVVEDPAVAELLAPKDYPYGTKRPPLETGYYETFNRDNVRLVDVRETPIEAITQTGVRTAEQPSTSSTPSSSPPASTP